MSEPVAKQRPTVDLDDFERRLRQQATHEDDPLAEMARLVGEQHDPYGDMFARSAQPLPTTRDGSEQGRREPGVGGAPPRALLGNFAAIEAGLRGTIDPSYQAAPAPRADVSERDYHEQGAQAHLSSAHDPYFAQEQMYGHDQAQLYNQAPYDQAAYDQAAYDPAAQTWAYDDRVAPPPARSRRPALLMAGTVAVCLAGIAGAYALKGHSRGPGEIRTIMAAAGPTKVQPPEDAAHEQAGQDAAGGDRAAQSAPTKLVSREEQPVDLAQAVRDNAARDAAAHPQTDASSVPVPLSPSQAQSAGADPIGEKVQAFGLAGIPTTKRVKVVSVRPDGTILPNDEPPAAAMPAPPRPVKASEAPGATATSAASKSASATPKSASTTPKSTSRVKTAPKPAEAAAGDDAAASPPTQPKPQRVASTQPDAQSTSDAAPAADSGHGGFAVQLAAPGSESDAEAATKRLAKKFSRLLSGHRLGFHRAQSNGRSVYRVRVSSLSREEAVSMCEKLKKDGGTCFVARN